MSNLSLSIKNASGIVLASSVSDSTTVLFYQEEYKKGDSIVLNVSDINHHYIIQLDDSITPAFVYMTNNEYVLNIPFDEGRISYNPRAFIGERHYITARKATKEEIDTYKNLAKNEYDSHSNTCCFPHAFANVETRGESVFAARNAIDGIVASIDHGRYPFASWGINQRDDATWELNFGRLVFIDKIVVFLRADFPHDNWWEKMTVTFSDGSEMVLNTTKSQFGQTFTFDKKEVSWVKLSNLIKADDPSPFPALTQFEVYGTES